MLDRVTTLRRPSLPAYFPNFQHELLEIQVDRDVYNVTVEITYQDERDWSVDILAWEPSFELFGAMATRTDIETALDLTGPKASIRDAVIEELRERDDARRPQLVWDRGRL